MKTVLKNLKIGESFFLSGNPKCQSKETELVVAQVAEDMKDFFKGFVKAQNASNKNSEYAFNENSTVFKKKDYDTTISTTHK